MFAPPGPTRFTLCQRTEVREVFPVLVAVVFPTAPVWAHARVPMSKVADVSSRALCKIKIELESILFEVVPMFEFESNPVAVAFML